MDEKNFFHSRTLDKGVPIPLYFQLKELIIEAIKSGEYKKTDCVAGTQSVSAKKARTKERVPMRIFSPLFGVIRICIL